MVVRMTVGEVRRNILRLIEATKELLEKYPDDSEFKARLEAPIDAYNVTFRSYDKRVKTWKCKICGREFRGVLKPIKSWFKPYQHDCELEEVRMEG